MWPGAPRDASETFGDLEVTLHRGLAVGQASFGDEHKVVCADTAARQRMFERQAARARDRNHDLSSGFLLYQANPALGKVDVFERKPPKITGADTGFECHDKKMLRALPAEKVRLRSITVVAHPGAEGATPAEPRVFGRCLFRLRHSVREVAAESGDVIEGSEKAGALFGVQF